ncbi:MAG TPA: hypothetical protein VFT64_09760 [Rickettsiales bacterium]|nr:hypothetical protein [Rickettsiales bacterium]
MGRNSTQNQTSNNDASYMWAAAAGAAAVGAAVGASKSYEEENKEAVYNNAVLGGGRKPDRTGSIFRTVLAVALGATAVYLGVQVNQSRSR